MNTLEAYPNKQELLRDIASGIMSEQAIANKYGLKSHASVSRFKKNHLHEIIQLRSYSDSDALIGAITQNLVRVEKMLQKLEAWAEDPDNPDEYCIAPRANEIFCIYTKPIFSDEEIFCS